MLRVRRETESLGAPKRRREEGIAKGGETDTVNFFLPSLLKYSYCTAERRTNHVHDRCSVFTTRYRGALCMCSRGQSHCCWGTGATTRAPPGGVPAQLIVASTPDMIQIPQAMLRQSQANGHSIRVWHLRVAYVCSASSRREIAA